MARRNHKNRPPKPPKQTFRERVTAQGRTAVHLSRTLVNEPKSFLAQVLVVIKRSARKLWNARGGGLYACGFVITFMFLEVRSLILQVMEANGFFSFITDQLLDFIIRFSLQSLENTIFAFIWPEWLIEELQGVGLRSWRRCTLCFPGM